MIYAVVALLEACSSIVIRMLPHIYECSIGTMKFITCAAIDAASYCVPHGRDFTFPPGWWGWVLDHLRSGLFK